MQERPLGTRARPSTAAKSPRSLCVCGIETGEVGRGQVVPVPSDAPRAEGRVRSMAVTVGIGVCE